MPRSVGLPLVLAVAAASLTAACDDPVAVGAPASLEILGDTLLAAGEPRAFSAVARTASGRVIADAAVTWEALDASVAGVDGGGRVTGVRPGAGGVVARLGALVDTARFRVRWGALERGELRGRVEGRDTADFRWRGLARVLDVLATDAGDRTTLVGDGLDPALRDSTIVLVLPSVLAAGEHAIAPYPLEGRPQAGPSALLAVGQDGPGGRVYYGTGGTLTVSEAVFPERPGLLVGVMRGDFVFRATRYYVGPDGHPVASGDTVTVTGEMLLDLQHLLLPSVHLTVDGGPVPGTAIATHGQASAEPDGFQVWWDADMDGVFPHPYPWELNHGFILRSPGVGTFPLGDVDPATAADPAAWPPAFAQLFYRDHATFGLSGSGSITITRWVDPTDAAYGEVHGTMEAKVQLWEGDTGTGRTVGTTATFAIPINPRGGVPS